MSQGKPKSSQSEIVCATHLVHPLRAHERRRVPHVVEEPLIVVAIPTLLKDRAHIRRYGVWPRRTGVDGLAVGAMTGERKGLGRWKDKRRIRTALLTSRTRARYAARCCAVAMVFAKGVLCRRRLG